MKNRIQIFIIIFIFCNSVVISQNTSCFQDYLDQIAVAKSNEKFDLAIDIWDAANVCPDKPKGFDVDAEIKKVNELKLNIVKKERDKSKREELKAHQAEKHAKVAMRASEAGRLAFLTTEELNKGDVSGAIKLAHLAYKLDEGNSFLQVEKAFGDAAYHYSLEQKGKFETGIRKCIFSPKNNQAILIDKENSFKIWDLKTDVIISIQPSKNKVNSISYSSDGKMFLTSSGNNIQLYKEDGTLIRTFMGHTDTVNEAIFSFDGKTIASCSRDQLIKIWNVKDGNLLSTCKGHLADIKSIQFSPNGLQLLSLSFDKTIRIWDMDGVEKEMLDGKGIYFNTATFSPNGNLIATGSVNNTVKLWSSNGIEINVLNEQHRDLIRHIAFSPDNLNFVSCSADSTAVLWKTNGEVVKILEEHFDDVTFVSFSKDGKYFVTCSKDHTAKMYDLEGNFLMNMNFHEGSVNQVFFSPDGKKILTCSDDRTVVLSETPETILQKLEMKPLPSFSKEEKKEFNLTEILFNY